MRSFVTAIKKSHVDTPGNRRDYQSVYLRRAYRDSGTVRNETVANQSMPPQAAIAAIEATLKGHTLVPARRVHDRAGAMTTACRSPRA